MRPKILLDGVEVDRRHEGANARLLDPGAHRVYFRPRMRSLVLTILTALTLIASPAVAQTPREVAAAELSPERRAALEHELAEIERERAAIDDTGPIVARAAGGGLLAGGVAVFFAYAMGWERTTSSREPEPDHTDRDWAFGIAVGAGIVGIALVLVGVVLQDELDDRREGLRLRIDALRGELGVAF
jgi:hypothetical protein